MSSFITDQETKTFISLIELSKDLDDISDRMMQISLLREYEDEGGDLYGIIDDFNDQIYIMRGKIKDFLLFVLSYNSSKDEAKKKNYQ